MADITLKRNHNGCEITITVNPDKKIWIQATGQTTKKLMDAVGELNYSTFDPSWVMKQLIKTL